MHTRSTPMGASRQANNRCIRRWAQQPGITGMKRGKIERSIPDHGERGRGRCKGGVCS
ncbi:hypothetical protein IB249_07725 [Pseudomonas sp. PDM04]|nr:hypothetical protein [Pseudomonas sp. PDM04]